MNYLLRSQDFSNLLFKNFYIYFFLEYIYVFPLSFSIIDYFVEYAFNLKNLWKKEEDFRFSADMYDLRSRLRDFLRG